MTTLKLRDLGFLASSSQERDPLFSSVQYLLRNGAGNGSTNPSSEDSSSLRSLTFSGGATATTAVFKYGSSSFSFNGTGGIETPHDTALNLGSGDFCLEAWVRPAALLTTGRNVALISKYTNLGYSYLVFFYRSVAFPYPISIFFDYTANNSTRLFFQANIDAYFTASVFTHYAISRQGTSLRFFANGNLVSTQTIGTTTIFDGTAPLQIVTAVAAGSPLPGSSLGFNGHLDDIRITVGAARYTAAFTPPQLQLPNF